MKLAVVASIDKTTTPSSKGGMEVWTSNFVLESSKRGHHIDLYATEGSIHGERVRLIPSLDRPLNDYFSDEYFTENPGDFDKRKEKFMSTVYASLLKKVRDQEDGYDIIVDSVAYPSFSFNTNTFHKPVLTIGHFPVEFMLKFYVKTLGWPENNTVVFPSRFQNDHATFLPESKRHVIPHGIDEASLTFSPEGGSGMLWMARVHHKFMNKGLDDALTVANTLKRPIYATGFIERSSRAYFDEIIRPLLSEYATFDEQGMATPIDKSHVFGNAKLFLFPLKWEEAFGLVMLESLACGTPVVAYARGAVPEIIEDGTTGFIVNSSADDIRGAFTIQKTGQEGLCEAVERIYAMSKADYAEMRRACRARIEKSFTRRRMFDGYEQLFTTITT
ncbi:MAG: glycosyltransferase [Parcubacteria group bacterium Gr01-1014_8]|nr:MAG: glycosyltransferase [Parcubacteria group bacterium Gr01-1014_8]